MIPFDPFMPTYLVVAYLCAAISALILCLLSLVGIYRTKKTPYGTKLLSLGLLFYDSLFLILSSVSVMFDYNDIYIITHILRGFQLSAQILVGCMALERLFVLKWPYVYLRVATDERTKVVCICIFLFSFIQYAVFRGAMCYAKNKAVNCGLSFAVYLIVVSFLVPAISFISYVKIYKIIRAGEKYSHTRRVMQQYKGTVASFLVLVNTTFTQFVTFGLSVLYFIRTSRDMKETGLVAMIANWFNLVNCIVDPLIYVIWFRETRMEILNIVKWILPYVKPKIDKMRIELYNISPVTTNYK